MKKLFLLPIIALVAVMAIANVSAAVYCCNDWDQGQTPCGGPGTGSWETSPCDFSQCDINACAQPAEFTSIGAGVAVAGAGVAYWFIRRKRK